MKAFLHLPDELLLVAGSSQVKLEREILNEDLGDLEGYRNRASCLCIHSQFNVCVQNCGANCIRVTNEFHGGGSNAEVSYVDLVELEVDAR